MHAGELGEVLRATADETPDAPTFDVLGLSCFYGDRRALEDVTLQVLPRRVTALIGPSGCGKSTFLRALNRMNETIDGARTTGTVRLDGQDLYDSKVDVAGLRRRVGMVFQRPQPFAKSIYENVVFGLRAAGVREVSLLHARVESALRRAALWDEVKDLLDASALALSVGQQQRLCIARALAVEPDALLLDEPASSLDPIATARIEDLLSELRKTLTLVMVTHSMQQAARVSQTTAFFHQGRLVELAETRNLFTRPRQKQTEDYITGRFG